MTSPERIADYFGTLAALLHGTRASDADGREIPVSDAFAQISRRARQAHGDGNKLTRAGRIFVATLSGFDADNPLRRMGDVNLYLASQEYGFVEIGHAALCHAVLDLSIMGSNRGDD